MLNKIPGVSILTDLGYSTGSSKNKRYHQIEVEPEENEIRNFTAEEDLNFDRCYSFKIDITSSV